MGIPKFIMKFLVILSLAAMAMARPQEQPASFACPNYPFCAIAANAPAPQQYQPHQDLYLAQRQALNQPLVADVPESPNGMLTSTPNKPLKDLTQESPSTKPVKLKYSWNKKDFLPTKLKVFKLLSGISLLALSENTIES